MEESKIKRKMELRLMNGKKNGSGKRKRTKAPSLSWSVGGLKESPGIREYLQFQNEEWENGAN